MTIFFMSSFGVTRFSWTSALFSSLRRQLRIQEGVDVGELRGLGA